MSSLNMGHNSAGMIPCYFCHCCYNTAATELGKAAMESALDAVAAMQAAVTANSSQMRVLVASIRDASDMATLAARVSAL
jgi:hypothetical protein